MADTAGSAGEVRVRLSLDATDLRQQITAAQNTIGSGTGIPLKVTFDEEAAATVVNRKIPALGRAINKVMLTAGLNVKASVTQINADILTIPTGKGGINKIHVPVELDISDKDQAHLTTLAKIGATTSKAPAGRSTTPKALQMGGYAQQNRPYIVGEAGPEVFVPRTSGRVVARHQGGSLIGGHIHNDRPPPFTKVPVISRGPAYDWPGPPYDGSYYKDPRTGRWQLTTVRTEAAAERYAAEGRKRTLSAQSQTELSAARSQRYIEGPKNTVKGWADPFVSRVVPRAEGPRDLTIDRLQDPMRPFRRERSDDDPNLRAAREPKGFIDIGKGGYNKAVRRYGRRIVLAPTAGLQSGGDDEEELKAAMAAGPSAVLAYIRRKEQSELAALTPGYGPKEWAAYAADRDTRKRREVESRHYVGPAVPLPRSYADIGGYDPGYHEKALPHVYVPRGRGHAMVGGWTSPYYDPRRIGSTFRGVTELGRTIADEATLGLLGGSQGRMHPLAEFLPDIRGMASTTAGAAVAAALRGHPSYRPMRRAPTMGSAAAARLGLDPLYSSRVARGHSLYDDPDLQRRMLAEAGQHDPMGLRSGSYWYNATSQQIEDQARYGAGDQRYVQLRGGIHALRLMHGAHREAAMTREAREAAPGVAAARKLFREMRLSETYGQHAQLVPIPTEMLNDFVPGLGNVVTEMRGLNAIRSELGVDASLKEGGGAVPEVFLKQADKVREMLYGLRSMWEERWGVPDKRSRNYFMMSPEDQADIVATEGKIPSWRDEMDDMAALRASRGKRPRRKREAKALQRERRYTSDPLGTIMRMSSGEAEAIEAGNKATWRKVRARGLAEGLDEAERDDSGLLQLLGHLDPRAQTMRDYQRETFGALQRMQSEIIVSRLDPTEGGGPIAELEYRVKKDPENRLLKSQLDHYRDQLRSAKAILNAQVERRAMGGAVGGLMDRLTSARVQQAMDEGKTEKSQKLQQQLEKARGGWEKEVPRGTLSARQLAPNQAAGHLPELANVPGAVLVGEHGPEVIVPGASGGIVFPNHWGGDPRTIPQFHSGGNLPRHRHRVNARGQNVWYNSRLNRWMDESGNIAQTPPEDAPTPGQQTARITQEQATGRLGLGASGTAGAIGGGAFSFRPRAIAQRLGPPPPEIAQQQAQFAQAMQPHMDSLWAAIGAGAQQAAQQAAPRQGAFQQQLGAWMAGGRAAPAAPQGLMGLANAFQAAMGQAQQQPVQQAIAQAQQAPAGVQPQAVAQAVAAAPNVAGPQTPVYDPAGRLEQRAAGRAGIIGRAVGPTGRTPQDEIAEIRSRISEQLSLTPVRALSVSIGQIFQQAVGGRAGIQERAAQANVAAARAQREAGFLEQVQQDQAQARFNLRRMVGQGITGGKEYEAQVTALASAEEAERIQAPVVREAIDEASRRESIVSSRKQRVWSQTLGLTGIVGGTLLFSNAMKIAQAAMTGIGEAAGPMVDAITGFTKTANMVTDDLSKTIIGGTGGVAEVAGAQAVIGLAGATPEVERRARLLAGSQNLAQIQDQIRAEQNLGGRPRSQGVLSGFNNGLFAGIPVLGDMLGWIGQTQGQAERILGTMGGARPASPTFAGEEGTRTIQEGERVIRTGLGDILMEKGAPGLVTDFIKMFGEEITPGTEAGRAADEQSIRRTRATWLEINDNITKVDKSVGSFNVTLDSGSAAVKRTADAMRELGEYDLADAMESYGVAFTTTAEDFSKAMEDAWEASGIGSTFQDIGRIVQRMRPALEAQLRGMERERAFQQEMIPADFARQILGQALPAPTTGLLPRSGTDIFGGAVPQTAMMQPFVQQISSIQDQMMGVFEEGLPRLAEISGFSESDLRIMQEAAQVTQDMRDDAADLQLGMEQARYNEQLRISRRGLGDLVGLAGKMAGAYGTITDFSESGAKITQTQVAQATEYGQLQRAQIMDQRQLSTIQLARSQRELNLSIALSRLRSPGETAAERAVRRREAEMLAKEQQRELNINRRSTTRGFRIQDIDIGRQLADALKAQGLAESERTIGLQVSGLNQLANARDQFHQLKLSFLDLGTTFGKQVWSAYNQAQTAVETASGEFLTENATLVRKAFDEIITNVERAYDAVIPTYQTRAERREQRRLGGGGGWYGDQVPEEGPRTKALPGVDRAAGGIFSANGAMSFIAGEAGSESVIVIRNPKLGMTSGGSTDSGGSRNVTVNINASVRSDGDVDQLVKKVIREIHQQSALVV